MARGAILTWLLPLVACLAAAGAEVYAIADLGYRTGFPRHLGILAAVPLPVAYLVAVLVVATASVGRTLPGRMALGVVLVAAPIAFVGAQFALVGRDPLGLAIGGFLLLCAMPMLLLGDLVPDPRPPTAYAPVVASGGAALLLVAGLLSAHQQLPMQAGAQRQLPLLAIAGVYLVLAALIAEASGAPGPGRFAACVLWTALSATGVYFLVASSAGPIPIALGALVTSASVVAIGPPRDVLSAEPSDAERRVR